MHIRRTFAYWTDNCWTSRTAGRPKKFAGKNILANPTSFDYSDLNSFRMGVPLTIVEWVRDLTPIPIPNVEAISAQAAITAHHKYISQAYANIFCNDGGSFGMPTVIRDNIPEMREMVPNPIWDYHLAHYAQRAALHNYIAGTASNNGFWFPVHFRPAATYNTTAEQILSEIQRHMLEPTIDGGVTWQLWTQAQVLTFLNQRLSRFLHEVGLIITPAVTATGNADDIPLPEDLIDIRGVYTAVSATSNDYLKRVDKWMADKGIVGWEADSTSYPYGYTTESLKKGSIGVVPPIAGSVSVELDYVACPTKFTSSNLNSALPIPSMFSWAIKYGVMADMFGCEGEANDPKRAVYCAARFDEGVKLAMALVGYGYGEKAEEIASGD